MVLASDPAEAEEPLGRWLVEHATQVLAGAGVVVSVIVGLSYEYFYGFLDVRPSELGLGSQDVLLHAALGVGFLLIFLVPLALLFAYTLGTRLERGKGVATRVAAGPEPAAAPSPTQSVRTAQVIALTVLLLVVVVGLVVVVEVWLPDATGVVVLFVAMGTASVGFTIAAARRLDQGIRARTLRAAWDISVVGYAAVVTFIGGVALAIASAVADEPSELGFAAALAFCTIGVLGVNRARQWAHQPDPARHARRLFHVRADAVAGIVVFAWIVTLVAAFTGADARYLLREGMAPESFGAPLRSAQITCVKLDWLDPQPPAGLPTTALYLGQAGGTTVLFQPGHGPLRVPSSRIALIPAPRTDCRR